jgi:hypothetical protein
LPENMPKLPVGFAEIRGDGVDFPGLDYSTA